jgi:methyltransferase (TIGR00027 family)
MPGPDLTAIGAAYGRVAHVLLDDPPYVLEDRVSIQLADREVLAAAQLITPDGRLSVTREDPRSKWRGIFVGRARFVEDLVVERLKTGVDQFVILGAGLDSFAQRRPEVTSRLQVFEVDEPRTQQWKQRRLRELGMPVPASLRFVPVDFESGASWVSGLSNAGFDMARPAVVASTGVAQYISADAMARTMQEAASLAPMTTFVSTFMRPMHSISDAVERELRSVTEGRAASLGFPWISFYNPEEFIALAMAAGFDDVRHVPASELNDRYFKDRPDGLRAPASEDLITATRNA